MLKFESYVLFCFVCSRSLHGFKNAPMWSNQVKMYKLNHIYLYVFLLFFLYDILCHVRYMKVCVMISRHIPNTSVCVYDIMSGALYGCITYHTRLDTSV